MRETIRGSEKQPFEAVVEEILQTILSGEYSPVEFLPTQSEPAAELDEDRPTVLGAIQISSALRLTDSRPGRGTWAREGPLRAMEATLHNDERFVEADLEFHTAVVKARHDVLLGQLYQVSRGLLSEPIAALTRPRRMKPASIRTQTAIAQAIEQGDVEAAREAAREHMALARR